MSNPFDRPSGPTGPDGPQRPGGNGGSGGARPATASRRPGALVITAIVLSSPSCCSAPSRPSGPSGCGSAPSATSEVFTTLLLTRIGLFFVFAGLMAAVVALAMAMAYRYRPVLWPGMPGDARRRDGPLPRAARAAHGLGHRRRGRRDGPLRRCLGVRVSGAATPCGGTARSSARPTPTSTRTSASTSSTCRSGTTSSTS